jgi:glycine/serine hydroxymethyltransferase
MTNNKQQTSVEWLVEQLQKTRDWQRVINEVNQSSTSVRNVIEQAKEMQEELMKGMYVEGSFAKMRYYDGLEYIDADQYYEQTYGGGDQ